jgi:hypothetical protein
LLKQVKFPPIQTLDTSKTPKAGEVRILAAVLAPADIENISRQIQVIQAAQGAGKSKSKDWPPNLTVTAKPLLLPAQYKAAVPPKPITATAPAQLGRGNSGRPQRGGTFSN